MGKFGKTKHVRLYISVRVFYARGLKIHPHPGRFGASIRPVNSREGNWLAQTIALRGGVGPVSNGPSADADSSDGTKSRKAAPIAMEAALQI